MFGWIKCMFGTHAVDRRNVAWEAGDFVGRCRHCAKEMRKDGNNLWKLIRPE